MHNAIRTLPVKFYKTKDMTKGGEPTYFVMLDIADYVVF